MRMCKDHWDVCRQAVENKGLGQLVARDGVEACDNAVADLKGEPDPKHERFDPLMSMNWHWSSVALKAGGLAMMGKGPDENEGHFCPLCELAAHWPDFNPQTSVNDVADQMATWARSEGLIPALA